MGQLARVLAMASNAGDLDGCLMWRVFQPIAELERQGFRNVGWDYLDNPVLAHIWHLYDALVLPRRFWEPEDEEAETKWFNLVQGAGKTVIYEIDDDLFSDDLVQRLVEVHGKSPERAQTIRDATIRAIRRADGVTVSSEYLRVLVEGFTDRPVHVVPNFIDLRWFGEMRRMNKRWIEPTTIGWAGGIRPDSDVEQMAIAWSRIAERFPHVTFVVMGHQAQVIYEHVPAERIRAIPWMNVDEYPAGLTNIDIGCCPLADTPFNRSKTYIKAMEYAAMGGAVVASPLLYQQIVDHGRNGYIARSVDDWERALATLLLDRRRRTRVAKRLLDDIRRRHSLERNVWRWLAAWNEIVEETRARRRHGIVIPALEGLYANAAK